MSFQYTNPAVPSYYVCSKCEKTGCKLWRDYQSFSTNLMCCDCAAEDQEKDISTMGDDGRYESSFQDGTPAGKTDQIGWKVPAIPTENADEDWKEYWGYCAVPPDGVSWWRRLPTRV